MLAVGILGCRESEAPRLVRLVDRAPRAVVAASPLLRQDAVTPAESTRLWHSDFEGDVLSELGWRSRSGPTSGAFLARDPDRGQVVCVRADHVERFTIPLPARPLEHYRVARELKTGWGAFDLKIVESSVKLPGRKGRRSPARLRQIAGRMLGKTAVLAVHRFAADAGAAWGRADLDFTTGLDTKSLVMLFEQVSDPSRPVHTEACLAELTVELLDVDPSQELALLRGAWARPGDSLGLVKRGRLLPLRRLGATQPPYDDNYEVRDALFAPAPTRLRFPLHLPTNPRLTFSYALSSGSRIGDEVEFQVVVERRGKRTEVFSRRAAIGPGGEGWHWRDAVVDLDRWAGADVVLELSTRSGTERGFGLWGSPIVDAPRRDDEPPNVILVGIDTLRADRLSSYGYERPTSPTLERLAADGVRFEQAISASNWTAPSFASIFTGLATARHGVVNQEFIMADSVETLAEHLRAGGWRTHAVVYKAALFGLGLDQGFDRWFNLPTSRRTAQTNLEKALAFLDGVEDRRFFLFLHLDDPHQPFNQPPPFDRRFDETGAAEALDVELPISIRNAGIIGCAECMEGQAPRPEWIRAAQDLYDGAIAYTDDRLGELLTALEQRGLYDDTVIAVVADHGEVIYDRFGLWGHGALLLTDEMVHVPLIIKPAGRAGPHGVTVAAQVRTTDLLPTLLESVGLPVAAEADSRSLWPLVEGREVDSRVAFFENPERGVVGLRTDEWKYVVHSRSGGPPVRRLFDLKKDPGETVDLAVERADAIGRLDEMLVEFLLRTRSGPFLLVVGDGREGAYDLVLERPGGGGYRSFVGLPPRSGVAARDSKVPSGSRILAFMQIDLGPERTAAASLRSGGELLAEAQASGDALAAYDPAALARRLARPAPGIYFLRGAPGAGATHLGPPTNIDQLEDLRDLGYIN